MESGHTTGSEEQDHEIEAEAPSDVTSGAQEKLSQQDHTPNIPSDPQEKNNEEDYVNQDEDHLIINISGELRTIVMEHNTGTNKEIRIDKNDFPPFHCLKMYGKPLEFLESGRKSVTEGPGHYKPLALFHPESNEEEEEETE